VADNPGAERTHELLISTTLCDKPLDDLSRERSSERIRYIFDIYASWLGWQRTGGNARGALDMGWGLSSWWSHARAG
jgi:hypothetical protein